MKIIIGIIGAIVFVLAVSYEREKTVTSLVTNVQATTTQNMEKIQERAEKQAAQYKYDNWAATKTKIYVRARDTKTCMKVLKINVLNNEVVECNKDHYVELRNDEVEKFKKEKEL
jgi:hypothetical protein